MFGDEVTEHHFYNSCQFWCFSLLRMLKNAFCDKMHVPRACSVARFVIAQCNWDAMHAPCACSVAQFVLPQCKLGSNQRQILRETFRCKDRRLHFEKCTKKLAKIQVIFFTFQIVNIRKDCLVGPARKPANLSKICKTYGKTVQVDAYDLLDNVDPSPDCLNAVTGTS